MMRSNQVLLTIGVPAFNEESSIAHSLRALLSSAERSSVEFEIVVVVSGSRDATVANARAILNDVPGARIIVEPERLGKAHALNVIAASARGEVLLFCDADALVDPEAVSTFVDAFVSDPELALAYARPEVLDGESRLFTWLGTLTSSAVDEYRSLADGSGLWFICGHLYAIRRQSWAPIPESIVADDPYLGLAKMIAGEKVAYLRKAIIRIKTPQTWSDYSRQKLRNRFARLQLPIIPSTQFVALAASRRIGLASVRYLPLLVLDTFFSAYAFVRWSLGHRVSSDWDQIPSTKLGR
jgi:glycosyltransferase involved in cell wall biosynthesis